MKRVLAGSLLLAGALATNLYGRDEIVWDQSSLKDIRCADSLPNLKFQSRSSFSLENTILFLWAAHVMENNSSDEVQSQFQDLGFSDIEMITPDSVGGAESMIAVSGDTMLIAFRGSKWIKDYLIDAEFFQRSSNVNEVRGKVHSGILRHYKNLRPALVNGIESRRHKVKKIFVTGHSLGGGLAQLTSLYIAKNKLPIKGLYTSAAPRLGDAEYLRDLEIHLQDKIYSAITQLDLVPHLPPSQWLAPEFAAIVPGDNVFTRWLKGFVEFLNYDVSPGQVTFIPQSGSWKTMKSFEKLSSERQYWERLKDSIQSGNIWQLFSDLQERFGTHTPEAYLCQLAEAESTKRSSLF